MLDPILNPLLEHPISSLISFILPLLAIYIIHILFLHPLSHVPGPLLRRLTAIPLHYTVYNGTDSRAAAALHARYGPVVLLAPNEVDIADGAAVSAIYVERGGFLKHPCYRNFDLDGFTSIFSTLDPAHRAIRAKSVAGLFATGRLRGASLLAECADDLVEALRRAAEAGEEMNVLDLGRRFALDSLSGYLYGRRYGALQELETKAKGKKLSAGPFVELCVAIGRFFLLPGMVFGALETTLPRLFPDNEVERSNAEVDEFVKKVVDEVDLIGGDTYQKRLLDAGISRDETVAQCKDIFFAGTDSTGLNLAFLIWNLLRYPEFLQTLQLELEAPATTTSATPFLHATIREGLRVSMANPTRLPRIVPASGWTFTSSSASSGYQKAFYFPPGTSVGVSAYSLHTNAETYPFPRQFDPTRWVLTADGRGAASEAMNRDHFAFGAGSRQCIARNLAVEELTIGLRKIVESGVLDGAEAVGNDISLVEWFNAKVADDQGIKIRLKNNDKANGF